MPRAADNSNVVRSRTAVGRAREVSMEIGLDHLYRETTRGEWGLAAFWLPSLFWRHLMTDLGESPPAIQEVLSGTRRAGALSQPLPAARLRSSLVLRDANGTEQRVLKTKLPPPMKALVSSLATTLNAGNPQPFVPLLFPAEALEDSPLLFPRVRGELELIARSLGTEELALRWPVTPALPELSRPRPRRKGEVRRT
jgi:hypothetical protein